MAVSGRAVRVTGLVEHDRSKHQRRPVSEDDYEDAGDTAKRRARGSKTVRDKRDRCKLASMDVAVTTTLAMLNFPCGVGGTPVMTSAVLPGTESPTASPLFPAFASCPCSTLAAVEWPSFPIP